MEKVHFNYQEKLDLLRQVLSPVGAADLTAEIDTLTFAQIRDLRDILHIIAQGKKIVEDKSKSGKY